MKQLRLYQYDGVGAAKIWIGSGDGLKANHVDSVNYLKLR